MSMIDAIRDGRFSRRDWLKLTAAGVAGASSSGWLLPQVAAATEGRAARAKSCIMLHMQGGMSQHHTFTVPDLHAQNQQIQTAVPGVYFCEHFPRLAARMGDLCLIRSMSTGNTVHERARSMMHTGYNPNGTVAYPSIGNVASCELGAADAELPNFVAIQGGYDGDGAGSPHRSIPAYLGPRHAGVPVQEPDRGLENLRTAVSTGVFDDGARLLDEFETNLQAARPSTAAAAHLANFRGALQLMRSPRMLAFEIDREPMSIRDAYGHSKFGKSLLLARRLVEAGVPFIEVTLSGWDDHGSAHSSVPRRARYVDPAIATLIDDLKQRGLFDDTLIVVMSEFGRTPQLAPSGYNQTLGAGHYAKAWTTVLAGGGVRGGTVVGRVDAAGGEVLDRPVNVQEFLATMCHALAIDYHKEYQTREGRPMTFLTPGVTHVRDVF